jgi:hypothetical protein
MVTLNMNVVTQPPILSYVYSFQGLGFWGSGFMRIFFSGFRVLSKEYVVRSGLKLFQIQTSSDGFPPSVHVVHLWPSFDFYSKFFSQEIKTKTLGTWRTRQSKCPNKCCEGLCFQC